MQSFFKDVSREKIDLLHFISSEKTLIFQATKKVFIFVNLCRLNVFALIGDYTSNGERTLVIYEFQSVSMGRFNIYHKLPSTFSRSSLDKVCGDDVYC